MTARTHDLAAVTALGIAVLAHPVANISLATLLVALFANQIGGITPDIDQPTAPFWRNLPIGGLFGKVVDKGLGGHRFLTHSLVGVALFGFLAKALLGFLHPLMPHINSGYVWWAFMIGMGSHLVMDTLTKEGVPWLLPLPFKFGIPPLRRLRITTGKAGEFLVIFPLLLAIDLWLCNSHYAVIVSYLHHHIGR